MFSLGNCLLFLSRFRDSFKLLKLIELADALDHLHGRLRYWHFHWIMFWYEISYVLCALTHNRHTAHTHTHPVQLRFEVSLTAHKSSQDSFLTRKYLQAILEQILFFVQPPPTTIRLPLARPLLLRLLCHGSSHGSVTQIFGFDLLAALCAAGKVVDVSLPQFGACWIAWGIWCSS